MKSLYVTSPKAAPKQPPAAARKSIYTAAAGSGSIENAVASCFDPLAAGVRDDPERLQQLRDTRKRVTRVLEDRHVRPDDAHTLLSAYLEHETFKRSAETIAKRWPDEWDNVRRKTGSTEAGERALAAADKLYSAIAQADPAFAHSAKVNGTAEDARVILVAANYAEPPVSKTQE